MAAQDQAIPSDAANTASSPSDGAQLNFNAVGGCLSIVIVGRLAAGTRGHGAKRAEDRSVAALQWAAFLH